MSSSHAHRLSGVSRSATAFASLVLLVFSFLAISAVVASASTLPVPNDILQISGGSLRDDGVRVFDLGDHDTFVGQFSDGAQTGERFPITINRPKGAEAGYAVSTRITSFSASNNSGFKIFATATGEEEIERIEFAAGETSKTIYIGEPYALGDNSKYSGTLTSYIYLYRCHKTKADAPICVQTTKTASVNASGLTAVASAEVFTVSGEEKLGESKVLGVLFQSDALYPVLYYCEVTSSLRLNLTNGVEMLALAPVEAVGSILNVVTFVVPPDAINDIGDGDGWRVVSVSGVKNANGTDKDGTPGNATFSLLHDLSTDELRVDDHIFAYADWGDSGYSYSEPRFGTVATDKDEYNGLETINVSVPVLNANDLYDFVGTYVDGERIGVSIDGGATFVSANLITWNEATNTISASFAAPVNNSGGAKKIAVEIFLLDSGWVPELGTPSGRGIYGAYKFIDIYSGTEPFVPVTSITVTGMPAGGIITTAAMAQSYPLTVTVLPANATFKGFSWATSNNSRAQFTGNTLHFNGDGRVTLTLTSAEAAYRTAQGLAPNSDLTQTYSFAVGEYNPRLVAGSTSVSHRDNPGDVFVYFDNNFGIQDGEWDNAVFSYEIKDADGVTKKTGTCEYDDSGNTVVKLTFDATTPQTLSVFNNGEFKPSYTITLTVTKGAKTISETASIFISPPAIMLESATASSTAYVGQAATFKFYIKTTVPGKTTLTSNKGSVSVSTWNEQTVDGLLVTTLGGSVTFTPTSEGEDTLTLSASMPGQESKTISRKISVLDASASLINAQFYDGLGAPVTPEPGDASNLFCGMRISKIAKLIAESNGQQKVYEYLDRMSRPQILCVTAPAAWGAMSGNRWDGTARNYLYANYSGVTTLSWENVPTNFSFTYRNDQYLTNVYGFRLTNPGSGSVTLEYTNGSKTKVIKTIEHHNGHVFFYEPNGLTGEIRITQNKSNGAVLFATIGNSDSGLSVVPRLAAGAPGAEVIVSATPIVDSQQSPAFDVKSITLSDNPLAKFVPVSYSSSYYKNAIVRYGLVTPEGAFIAGTGGETGKNGVAAVTAQGEFQLPFQNMFQHPDARLVIEYQFTNTSGGWTRTELPVFQYDLDTLYEKWKNNASNIYKLSSSSTNYDYIGGSQATVTSANGLTKSVIGTQVETLQSDDTLDIMICLGTRTIKTASLNIRNYAKVGDNAWTSDSNRGAYTTTATAGTNDISYAQWGFTPNKYATIRFRPADEMTPALLSTLTWNLTFTDDTTANKYLGYAMVRDNGLPSEEAVAAFLEANEPDFFTHGRLDLNVADLSVAQKTKDYTIYTSKYNVSEQYGQVRSLSGDIANILDSINVKAAIPLSAKPFKFHAKRKGNEYLIYGYVNATYFNENYGWEINGSDNQTLNDSWQSFKMMYDSTKSNVDYFYNNSIMWQNEFGDVPGLHSGEFPSIRGYLEGKAVIDSNGNLRFTWNAGRIKAISHPFITAEKKFDLPYYYTWATKFHGMNRTLMEIAPAVNGGDPSHPFNFDINEKSVLKINNTYAHNGGDFNYFVVELHVGVTGEIKARVNRNTTFRPYATGMPMSRTMDMWTGGDFRQYAYYGIRTDLSDFPEKDESNRALWFTGKYKGTDSYVEHHWSVSSGTAGRLSSVMSSDTASNADTASISAAPASFSTLASLSTPVVLAAAASTDSSADAFAKVLYYKNGTKVLKAGADGIPNSAFGLDAASAKNGITLAAWGAQNSNFDAAALKTLGQTAALKYALGMSEVAVGIHNGTTWNITTLTNNAKADLTPKTATNGTAGIVVWTQGVVNISDGDSETDGVQPLAGFDEARLMFARYNGSAWSAPATLFAFSNENISTYSVAMANDGSALAVALTKEGRTVVVKIGSNGTVAEIGNNLPNASQVSLLHNGATYTLASLNAETLSLTLSELSADGFVKDTAFSGIPQNTGANFKLSRDWNKSGNEAVVLAWAAPSFDPASVGEVQGTTSVETVFYASRMSQQPGDDAVLICVPVVKTLETSAEVSALFDVYCDANALKIVAALNDGTGAHAEITATFTNAIATAPAQNAVASLTPGISTNLSVNIKNDGFAKIESITAQITGEASTAPQNVSLWPNGETTITIPFTPARNLPDSVNYTVIAKFADGGTATANGEISLPHNDIEVTLLSFSQDAADKTISAITSNNTPFSLTGKKVVVGVYSDSFGTTPIVAAQTISGSDFETNSAVVSEFELGSVQNLPDTLYLLAHTIDASGAQIPDSDNSNNVVVVDAALPAAVVVISPSINTNTQPPSSQSKNTGDKITFGVSASAGASGGTLTYQWKKNGVNIAGATNSSYTIGSAKTSDAGNYTVVVTNTSTGANATFGPYTLAVSIPPLPAATLSLSADSWKVGAASDTHIISLTTNQSTWEATSSASWLSITKNVSAKTLTLTVTENTAATRKATITVIAGSGSNTATQTLAVTQDSETWVIAGLTTKGVKLTPPKTLVVPKGTKLAKGTKAIYVWKDAGGGILRDAKGKPISAKTYTTKVSGAFTVELRYTPLSADKKTVLPEVVLTHSFGKIKLFAPIKLAKADGFVTEPLPGNVQVLDTKGKPIVNGVVEGESLRLTVKLESGTGPLKYTWYLNKEIVKVTGPTYSLTDTFDTPPFGAKPDAFSVVVETIERDAKGNKPLTTATSKAIKAKVINPPKIVSLTVKPAGLVAPGKSATLAVKATGTKTLAYEWRGPDGKVVKDAKGNTINKASLTLKPASKTATVAGGTYTVKVTNPASSGEKYIAVRSVTVQTSPSSNSTAKTATTPGLATMSTAGTSNSSLESKTGHVPSAADTLLLIDAATGETRLLVLGDASLQNLHTERLDAGTVRMSFDHAVGYTVGKDATWETVTLNLTFHDEDSGNYVMTVDGVRIAANGDLIDESDSTVGVFELE